MSVDVDEFYRDQARMRGMTVLAYRKQVEEELDWLVLNQRSVDARIFHALRKDKTAPPGLEDMANYYVYQMWRNSCLEMALMEKIGREKARQGRKARHLAKVRPVKTYKSPRR